MVRMGYLQPPRGDCYSHQSTAAGRLSLSHPLISWVGERHTASSGPRMTNWLNGLMSRDM